MDRTPFPTATPCDLCGSPAVAHAVTYNHSDAYFCGFHFDEEKVVLELTALTFTDTRAPASAGAI